MKKRILSILLILCVTVCIMPISVYAVQDSTKNAAKSNFGLTNESVNYIYLNDQGAYKHNIGRFPHFINADSGIYHIHGKSDMNSKLPDLINKSQYPNNIEIKAGGTVKLLFDGTLDGDEGLVWDYSALGKNERVSGLTNEYSMIKLKNGSNSKPTNVEIHFAGKCTISAPRLNAVINTYGSNCNLTVVLHDDCDVTLRGGLQATAIGGSSFEEGRNITIKTDGKYDTSGNRISYKANGKLTCYGGDQAAAIGSSNWANADNITIESGLVYAYGGDGGAGIGSGVTILIDGHTTICEATNIKIKGGTVYATGGDSAAGIGGGDRSIAKNISITGGNVFATGGNYSAGIGGGSYASAENITVSGGRVESTGGKGAAGIGGGYGAGAENITVSGGYVKAILTGKYNAYPIGRGYQKSGEQLNCKNNTIKVPDSTKVSLATTLKSGDTLQNKFYSCDSFDLRDEFGYIIDENNTAVGSAVINFEKCENHSLVWHPLLHYRYCTNCQSIKAYDDNMPSLTGIDNTVVYGSWVKFDTADTSDGGNKSITHEYYVGTEKRSVVFESVPSVAAGIKNVKVETFTYDKSKNRHSILSDTQTLTETSDDNGKKSYQFRGANAIEEYTAYKKAETYTERMSALKMQRITITDNAGNIKTFDVYALLSHHIECYVDGVKQILSENPDKDYLDLIRGSDLTLTFLKDRYPPLGYQYFYVVTVNGNRVPTTEDNVYEFNNIQEDLTIIITRRFDETAPELTVNVNGDKYSSTENGNDKSECKKLGVGATVTLSAEDVAIEDYPSSGINTGSFYYLISEKNLTEDELKNTNGWIKYDGAFTLPDSKVSIVYAKVQDIAGNVTYASSAPYLPDETAPTVDGLRPDEIYCEDVHFTVFDSVGIKSVKAGDAVLTPDNDGKYTLTAGLGRVTVTVTDNAGHSVSVTVTVYDGHTAGEDDGDCTTPVYCIYHPDTAVIEAKEHDFSGKWFTDSTHHHRACQNDGCLVEETPSPHSGGTATCTDKAICSACGIEYGKTDPLHHSALEKIPAKAATTEAEGNIEYWYCSGCDKYFTDESATVEITKANTVTEKSEVEKIEEKEETSPKTDGTDNIFMWISLLFAIGGVCTATEEYIRRKILNRR